MTDMEPGELPPEGPGDSYVYPEKDTGHTYHPAQETTVLTNLFQITIDDQKKQIHKYRIELIKFMETKRKESDITKGPKNDAAKQLCRRVVQSLFYDLFNYAKAQGNPLCEDKHSLFYDSGNYIYSCEPLLCLKERTADEQGKKEVKYVLNVESISSNNTKSFLGHYCTQVIFTVSPVLDFSLKMGDNVAQRRETQQFLEVLTTAYLKKEGEHLFYNNKVYPKSSQHDFTLGEGKSIKPGFEKNCCIGEQNGKPVALLQLDAKKSPFFRPQALVDFCLEYLQLRSKTEVEEITKRHYVRKLSNQLKGVVVRTIHCPNKHRTFAIAKVEDKLIKDVTFEKDGDKITLADYFRSQYNFCIKYPNSPVICERKRDGFSYYPMECLEIERGQRVSNQKASAQLAEKQIEQCRMSPPEMQKYLENAWRECALDEKNAFLATFGVKIEARWQRAKATVLHPPKIQYRNSAVECDRNGFLNWRFGRDSFVYGGKIGKIVVVSFDGCADDNAIFYFIETLLNAGHKQGIEIDDYTPSIVQLRSESFEQIEEFFEQQRKNWPFVIAISPTKNDEVHGVLKAMEAKYGIVTLNVARNTFNKVINSDKGSQVVVNNLLMKVNLKARGVNFHLGTPWAFLEANGGDKNIGERLMPKFRMLVGLDVSHASPQSFADRQIGTNSNEPSVVGMSYSIESPTQMHGRYWFQEPRLATISDLEKHMLAALLDFKKVRGRLPDDIIIYRGGVSEGEYQKVVKEVNEMKKAFALAEGARYNPSIQAIVVQTNSNFRMIPERIDPRGRPADQNVHPGTCIDHTITNPAFCEFLLVGQKGLMGTVRPIRCVIVVREKGATGRPLTFEDSKILTHTLCYGHQVVAGPTTLPCLLTAATNLSKRGRNNWKAMNFRNGSDAFSSGSDGALRHDGTEDFFQRLSETVGSSLSHHYWA